MLEPRTMTHAQLASIVTDVQKILWQESRLLPDFPREMGEYWNPAKQDDSTTLEQIADVLADLKPPDFMPVDLAAELAPTRLDANELLWAARVLAGLIRPHVIPALRTNLKLAKDILESYADIPVFDPRDQRWTITK